MQSNLLLGRRVAMRPASGTGKEWRGHVVAVQYTNDGWRLLVVDTINGTPRDVKIDQVREWL
jgi:hypothetical protein